MNRTDRLAWTVAILPFGDGNYWRSRRERKLVAERYTSMPVVMAEAIQ